MKRYCGVDLGGTNIAAGIVDEEYQILTTASAPTPKGVDGVTLAAAIAQVVAESAQKAGLTVPELDGVGMGAPGYIDPVAGINRSDSGREKADRLREIITALLSMREEWRNANGSRD